MKKNSRRSIGALAVGLTAVITAGMATPAFAHGATENPISRSLACANEGWSPTTAACKDVVTNSSAVLGDWQSVVVGDIWPDKTSDTPQVRSKIPDGKLCSAGREGFEALDNVHDDWATTPLTSGEDTVLSYYATVQHQPYSFESYVTKDGWDADQPLTWDALDPTPFLIGDSPEFTVDGGKNIVNMPVSLPQGKSGKHMVYTIWRGNKKQDNSFQSYEAFFSCSDVTFQ